MIKQIDDELFCIYKNWLNLHGWPDAPRELFPKYGFMAFCDDIPVIAGWIYRDKTCAYSMMEYVVSNPDVKKEMIQPYFEKLSQAIFNHAKNDGAKIMHMAISSNKKTFGKRLESVGFLPTDDNVTLYLKTL